MSNLAKVGFRVFQTGENADISPSNMPNIALEINPHVAGKTYTSMLWVPNPAPVTNQWSPYLDATTTGKWYFSNGSVAAATGCDQTLTCTFNGCAERPGQPERRIWFSDNRHGRDLQGS